MFPHQMNSTSIDRASTATRRDQSRMPWIVRSRRDGIARRSIRFGKPASTSDASPCWPVETTSEPAGYRLASSAIQRAIPPPIGGKSYVSSRWVAMP